MKNLQVTAAPNITTAFHCFLCETPRTDSSVLRSKTKLPYPAALAGQGIQQFSCRGVTFAGLYFTRRCLRVRNHPQASSTQPKLSRAIAIQPGVPVWGRVLTEASAFAGGSGV